MTKAIKTFFSYVLRFGLSAVFLIYLFNKIDKPKMAEVLRYADFSYLLLGLAVFFVINILLLIRWGLFIKALGLRVPVRSVFNCYFIGLFFNLFLPSSTGGDLVKTIGLFRDTPERAKVVATVVLDRLSGFISIVLVALVTFTAGFRYMRDTSLLISILALAGISMLIILVLFNERIYEFGCRVFNKVPKVKGSLMKLHYAIVLLKGKNGYIFSVIAISSVSQMILAVIYFLVAKALGQDIGLIYFMIFVPLICVISSLPSIGGLGVRDAGTAYLFAKVGVSTATAVSISLINFMYMVVVGLVGGALYVTTLSSGRIQRYQIESAVSPQEP